MSDKLTRAWAAVQDDRVADLLEDNGATWWRCHRLAEGLGEPWMALDAELLQTNALARRILERREEA